MSNQARIRSLEKELGDPNPDKHFVIHLGYEGQGEDFTETPGKVTRHDAVNNITIVDHRGDS